MFLTYESDLALPPFKLLLLSLKRKPSFLVLGKNPIVVSVHVFCHKPYYIHSYTEDVQAVTDLPQVLAVLSFSSVRASSLPHGDSSLIFILLEDIYLSFRFQRHFPDPLI